MAISYKRPFGARSFAAGLLLAACAVSMVRAAEDAPPSAGEMLPDSTVLMVRFGTWSQWANDWNQTSVSKICGEPEVQAFLAGPLAKLREMMADPAAAPADPVPAGGNDVSQVVATIMNWLHDVAPGPVTVAVCRGAKDAQGAVKPPATALIMRSQNVGNILTLAQILQDKLLFKVVQQQDYQTAKLLVVPTEHYSFTITEYGKHLIFTTDSDLCKQIVDGIGGLLQNKLSAAPAFKGCGLTGAEPMGAYLDVAALREMVGAQKDLENGRLKQTLDFLGVEDLHAVAWSMRLDGPAFASRAAFMSKDGRAGLLAALDAQPLSPESLKICPPHAPFAIGLKAKPEYLSRLLRNTMGGGDAQARERMNKVWEQAKADGRDLSKEMAEAYGNELVVASYQDPESPTLGAGNTLVVSLSVKDAAKSEELLVQVLQRSVAARNAEGGVQVALQEVDYEGRKVRYVRAAQGGTGTEAKYVMTADRLVVAMDMLILKAALKNLKDPGLAGTARFQEALKGTGGSLGSLFVYVDWGQWYAGAFNVGATALKFIAPSAMLKGLGLDLNLLPAPEAVTKHLFPALAVVEASEKGVVMTSRSPLPSLEVVAPPVAAFAAVLATFGPRLGGENAEQK
ncbi:MAG: DUF3352 domain-containing protein [Planctomycetes bacterium]|nr:DUF3352 domain-containing protein [Planctomycetota bacterium]